jgi:KaiC/GvpD/RAD55 family RecA-like ATPase
LLSTKKQKLLIEYIISSIDVYVIVLPVLQSRFFDVELRHTVDFIIHYYSSYNELPSISQINAEADDNIIFEEQQLSPSKIEYTIDEIEQFCRRKAIEFAVLASPKLIEQGDYQGVERDIKEAITLSIHKSMGLDYFSDPTERIKRMLTEQQRTTTGWTEVDDMLAGGILRQEMVLFSANSGGGKSIIMLNLGVNMAEQGFDVLYVSLELSENVISQRMDAMISGIPTAMWKNKTDEIIQTIDNKSNNMGKFIIKNMPAGTTSAQIESYLKDYELRFGKMPDVLIIDYLDIMGAKEKISADNVSEKDKMVAEQIRNLAVQYDMFLLTASQQNRGAITATEVNMSHIAGGMTKINTTDVYISIILTDELRRDDKIVFHFLKTRNSDGVGNSVVLGWDAATLRVTNLNDRSSPIVNILNKRKRNNTTVDAGVEMFETKKKVMTGIAGSL